MRKPVFVISDHDLHNHRRCLEAWKVEEFYYLCSKNKGANQLHGYRAANLCLCLFSHLCKTRIDVYETLCPQQMLVHKGGKIKNWGGECRDVTPTKLQSQNIFKESTGGGGGGGLGGVRNGCERRIKVFVKIQKNKKYFFFFFFWGGGGVGLGGGVRVDVEEK